MLDLGFRVYVHTEGAYYGDHVGVSQSNPYMFKKEVKSSRGAFPESGVPSWGPFNKKVCTIVFWGLHTGVHRSMGSSMYP